MACIVDSGRRMEVLRKAYMQSRDMDLIASFCQCWDNRVNIEWNRLQGLFEHGIIGRVHYASLVCVRWSLPWRFQHSRKASICVD